MLGSGFTFWLGVILSKFLYYIIAIILSPFILWAVLESIGEKGSK